MNFGPPTVCMLTGANEDYDFTEMAVMCEQSIKLYAVGVPVTPRRVLLRDRGGKPSWDKLRHIKSALEEFEYVLWLDADSLVVGRESIHTHLGHESLYISEDENGINCGVMAFRRTEQSFATIDRMQGQRWRLAEHIWFEQAALMEFVGELDVRKMPKPFFNAYPEDVTDGSLILHWPGLTPAERICAMRERFDKIT